MKLVSQNKFVQKQSLEVFFKKDAIKNLAKFT